MRLTAGDRTVCEYLAEQGPDYRLTPTEAAVIARARQLLPPEPASFGPKLTKKERKRWATMTASQRERFMATKTATP